jgi:DNA-binding MarR family transcriptional regulator
MVADSLSGFAIQLAEIMPDIMRGFMKREANALSQGNITVPQMFIVSYLYKEKKACMTDIARHLYVTTAAATGLVSRLVKIGLVKRGLDASDCRVITVRLTGKGLDVLQRVKKQKLIRIREIFSRMPPSERQEYLRILTRIKRILEQERG